MSLLNNIGWGYMKDNFIGLKLQVFNNDMYIDIGLIW